MRLLESGQVSKEIGGACPPFFLMVYTYRVYTTPSYRSIAMLEAFSVIMFVAFLNRELKVRSRNQRVADLESYLQRQEVYYELQIDKLKAQINKPDQA